MNMLCLTCRTFSMLLLASIMNFLASDAHADMRSDWNLPQEPFRIYGNTYYVGTHGLGSILITSPNGHILIDGALPESVPQIEAHIKQLGFRVQDIKLILNTHIHFDHAGGIAALQKASGARVAASPASAQVLTSGHVGSDDPQFGTLPPIDPVANVQVIADQETLKVGLLAIQAHFTPGHTPGGTSWTWQACDRDKCENLVYADSLNPVSADGYLYGDHDRHPNGATQLESSYKVLAALPCDILLAPHPDFVDLFAKLQRTKNDTTTNAFIDRNACNAYVKNSSDRLSKRLVDERK